MSENPLIELHNLTIGYGKVPLLEGKKAPESGPVAYVCRDATCGPPAHNAEQLAEQLSAGTA